MSFKDMVAADIQNVFFQAGEFAELHDIDGTKMLCVIDDFSLNERNAAKSDYADGLYSNEILLLVPCDSYGDRPKNGRRLALDGKAYFIKSVEQDMGVFTFRLGAGKA